MVVEGYGMGEVGLDEKIGSEQERGGCQYTFVSERSAICVYRGANRDMKMIRKSNQELTKSTVIALIQN